MTLFKKVLSHLDTTIYNLDGQLDRMKAARHSIEISLRRNRASVE